MRRQLQMTGHTHFASGLMAVCLTWGGCSMEQASPEEVAVTEQALHAWGNYHWARTTNPFTLKLNDFVTSQWDARLAEASVTWSASSVLDTIVVQPSTAPSLRARKTCTAISGQIKVCNATYGFNGWLGLAQISVSGSHITQGMAKMNDSYYDSASYPYNTYESRQMVMCQEIAHDFGLGHQDEKHDNPNLGSCMDYTQQPAGGLGFDQNGVAMDYGPANTVPNAHDFAQLESIYAVVEGAPAGSPGHVDGTTTVKQRVGAVASVGAGSSIDTGNGPQDVGKPVGHDEHGRPNTFVRYTGPDTLVLTHVYWAD